MRYEKIGKCRVCGAKYSVFFYEKRSLIRKIMFREGVCGTCATWMSREIDPSAKEEVIDGVVYKVYPYCREKEVGDFLGGKGRTVGIMNLKTLATYKSNDVWKVGTPPPAFKTPDTAIFVDKSLVTPLKDGPFECQGRLCLDRYTCAFYFKEKTEPDGPANNIPKNWIDGSEKCQSYLNINKINKQIMEWRTKKQ